MSVLLVWPVVAVLGFVVLTGVVIALAASSTAQYDFERNRVHDPRAAARAASTRTGAGRASGRRSGGVAREPRRGPAQPTSGRLTATSVATHPAGRRIAAGESVTGWWLVDQTDDGATVHLVAGPFDDRLEADWAALAGGLLDAGRARVVYGVRTLSGAILPKPAPQEQAWMLELGQQLTRLGEDWFDLVSDTDPLTTLVVEVTEALLEAGLPLHDCAGPGSAGGVCLTPYPERGGIVVSWHGHDRMTLQQVHGADADTVLRHTLGTAAASVLAQRGFEVEQLSWSGSHLVTADRR